jgi:glutaredoxin
LTGRLAIPTIVVNEKVIGGYTELTRLYGWIIRVS